MRMAMDDFLQGCARHKPYAAMIFAQSLFAGTLLFSKAAIAQGMNPYIFVVYRQGLAAFTLAPFAFYLERSQESSPDQLSFSLLCMIFAASTMLGLSLNLYCYAFNYVSAAYLSALMNTIPAITFILAVAFGMESLSRKQKWGMIKVICSVASFAGALICTFARGPTIYPESRENILHTSKQHYTKVDWIKGSLLVLAANASWGLWITVQAPLVKRYPSKMRLTTLQCLFTSATSAIWAASFKRDIKSWKLEWNLNLLSVLYTGTMTPIIYWLQIWTTDKRGPVFNTAFGPLALIITAIFSAALFHETLRWGSVGGAILTVISLYGILWAKSKEAKVNEEIRDEEVKEDEQSHNMQDGAKLAPLQA